MKYLKFLKMKIYLAVLIVSGFAVLGSVLGARKESNEPVLIYGTLENADTVYEGEEDGLSLAEYLPLAADQNRWYNFKYAFVFGGTGIAVYCTLMAIYLPLYNKSFFVNIREKMKSKDKKSSLFINL